MEQKRLRIALFGRFYSEGGEFIQSQKDKLREEAKNRNYEIVDEFWEEDLAFNTSLEDRPEMKRLITSVWTDALNIDGIFLPDLEHLSITSRKEHVTLMVLFEQNNIALITINETYNPDDWMAGLSF